jgi:hypothetical protein
MAIERWGENSNCDWTGVTEDSYIDSSDSNIDRGVCTLLNTHDGLERCLIKFSLSELTGLDSAAITYARLYLKTSSIGEPSDDISAHRIKRNWHEGSGLCGSAAGTGTVTWQNAIVIYTSGANMVSNWPNQP